MKDTDILKQAIPFDILPGEELQAVSVALEEVRFDREEVIYEQHKTPISGLDIVISGGYEAFFHTISGERRLVRQVGAHGTYGAFSILLNKGKSINTVEVQKKTKVLRLPAPLFKQLCEKYPEFYRHFLDAFGREMLNEEFSHFVTDRGLNIDTLTFDRYFTRRLDTIGIRPLVSCAPHTPAYEVAALMEENKLSCVFVEENGEFLGYVTDILLRNKVVGARQDAALPVREIMEGPIFTISRQAYVFEAILLMFRHKIRYLIVQEEGRPAGVISRSKLLSDQSQSPFVFIQSVRLAVSVDELRGRWQQVPEMVYNLLTRGIKSEIVNQIITNISDTIAQKVIEGVIAEVGPPPARFVFMSLGSEGRKEQTLKTDQDNAIIYEDKANEFREKTRKYFLDFADRVASRLNFIGFSFCTGGLMAKNPKWTHSLSHWKRNYDQWISNPDAQSVMNFSTFFDCRGIFGDLSLIGELQAHILEKLDNPGEYFFYQLANNALQYEPPLTFFKNIRTISKGDQKVFNIKRAMTPIVDLVRVYALQNKILKTNTGERLEALQEQKTFTDEDYHELMQSYYYLMGMRLKHQAHMIMYDGQEPDNFISLSSVTQIEVVTLKQIFKVIENFQQRIRVVFTRNLFG